MSNLPSTADVLIVGAGPAGLTAACCLLLRGIRPVIIEMAAGPHEMSKACAIQGATMDAFQYIGLHQPLSREGQRLLFRTEFDEIPTDFKGVLLIPQNKVEAALRQKLAELGGTIHYNQQLVSIDKRGDIEAHTESGHSIRAKFIIGADGKNSTVRSMANIHLEVQVKGHTGQLADITLKHPIDSSKGMFWCFSPEGARGCIPLSNRQVRVVRTGRHIKKGDEKDEGYWREQLSKISGYNLEMQELGWNSFFFVSEQLVDRYNSGNILLAGDAAHAHSPMGGQGLNLGVRDAYFLADVLSDILQDKQSTSALDHYSSQRKTRAKKVVGNVSRFSKMVDLPWWMYWLPVLILFVMGWVPGLAKRSAVAACGYELEDMKEVKRRKRRG
ncbi:2-polyprenyl-6-methoxyphenol hydroxylase-like oxidoreductase [Planoprotostelium fungivorum]|uniref:2-polyprenyl-6-methoxyphenol hydroxylase-like oxidoreductase n=1 Tax=Planoprotostelium fungivorum TaxID=1890364 RepID=A0A2P6NGD7_9EUKA|nr:2-polyprenyl-6-methoxyphenol hydroxylase-like oxidoreductase [Planoprotostelium fungivorum]